MQNRKALVLGSTGLIGHYCVQHLLEQMDYEEVYALVRKPSGLSHPNLREIQVNFRDISSWQTHLQVDDVYCCLGTTIRTAGSQDAFRYVDYELPLLAARIALEAGVEQYLVVSSLGADSHSSNFYLRVKGELEDSLHELPFRALHVFRPSMLLGPRKEFRLGEKVGKIVMLLFRPLMQGPLKPYRAIHARKVAHAMVRMALAGKQGQFVYISDEIERLGG